MTERNPYKQIIDHYGEKHQIRKLAEEQYELIEALYDRFVHGEDVPDMFEDSQEITWFDEETDRLNTNIADEIADCLVVIRQFMAMYGITQERVERHVEKKLKRQLEMIEKGE